MRNGKLLRRPTTRTSCSSSFRMMASTSPSKWHLTWRRAVTLTCLLSLLTTHKVRRCVAWCLDPVLSPIMALWGRTVDLRTCSMWASHQVQVTQVIFRNNTAMIPKWALPAFIWFRMRFSRKTNSTEAELFQVRQPSHRGQPDSSGSSGGGLLHKGGHTGSETYCAGESRNQSQSEYGMGKGWGHVKGNHKRGLRGSRKHKRNVSAYVFVGQH